MKNILLIIKTSLLLFAFMLCNLCSEAATFTAVASGNWSSSATWGGTAPGSLVTSDQITIPIGITVNLDNNATMNGALASLDVQGTLTSSTSTSLTVDAGTIIGNGVISVHHLVLNTAAVLTYTGSIAVDMLTTTATSLSVAADVMVNETLTFASGVLNLQSGGSLDVGSDADIVISGGLLTVGSGSLGLSGSYNVIYTTSSAIAGLELSGSGLNDVTIDVSGNNTVTLSSDLTVDGILTMNSGTLVLGGNDLTITGDVSLGGAGYISSTSASNISINAIGGVAGTLAFDGSGNSVNNLTIIVGAGNQAHISGMLSVDGALTLTSGSLNFSGGHLVLNGTLNGSGTFYGNSSSDLEITSSGGLSGTLNFATGGQMVNDLTLNVGSGNSANLGSDLTVGGILSLTGGSNLNISGQTLTIGNNGDITGTGSLLVNTSSGLIVNSTNGIANAISISGSSIQDLTVNTGNGNSVTLANDLTVNGTLDLQNGILILGGNDLTISGDVASGGNGTITTTSASDLRVTGNSSISGLISFTPGTQTVGDFTINIGSGNSVSLGSDVTVAGSLNLNGGSYLNISGHSLVIGSGGDISGTGALAVNSSSSLVINANNGITGALNFSGSSIGTLTVNAGNGNSVTLGSDLMISNLLDLQSGTLIIAANDLMIDGDISSGGSGTITSSNSSNIFVSGSSSPAGYLVFSSGGNMVNNFTVDLSGNSSVMLGSDLTVNGTLTFNDGNINIGDNELSIGDSGSISGGGSSSYVITGADGYLSIDVTAGGSGSVNFPVGTSGFYAPANISLNSGSSSGTVSVSVASDVWAEGTTGGDLSATQPLVDATWDIESDISSNLNMDIELMWSSSMEVNGFTNSSVYISHYTAGNWDAVATAAATAQGGGMFSVQRNNITSLSPFAVFDHNTTTGVIELSENSNFEIYPIPAAETVSVRNITSSPGIVYVDMMNASGQLVKTFSMNSSNETVSLDGLSAGNYFLKFYNNDLNEVRKIIKQ